MSRITVFPPQGSIDIIEWVGRIIQRPGHHLFRVEYKPSRSIIIPPRLTLYHISEVQTGPRAGRTNKIYMRSFDTQDQMFEAMSELRQRYPQVNTEIQL